MDAKLNTAGSHHRWQPDNDFELFYSGFGQEIRCIWLIRIGFGQTLHQVRNFHLADSNALVITPPPSPKHGRDRRG